MGSGGVVGVGSAQPARYSASELKDEAAVTGSGRHVRGKLDGITGVYDTQIDLSRARFDQIHVQQAFAENHIGRIKRQRGRRRII